MFSVSLASPLPIARTIIQLALVSPTLILPGPQGSASCLFVYLGMTMAMKVVGVAEAVTAAYGGHDLVDALYVHFLMSSSTVAIMSARLHWAFLLP